ncbi:MAG: glycosyltransferase family 4 protein [Chloroflexota bacterium]
MNAALFSIDPLGRGGALTSLQAVYQMLHAWNVEPHLVYLNAALGDGLTPRELVRRGRFWDAQPRVRSGMPGLAIGHVPARLPALAYQWWPYPSVRRYLDRFQIHLVLGVPQCGITAAMLRKRYVCWTATLLEDELRARADGGEPWARNVLSSPLWPLMVWQERFVLNRAARIMAVSQHTADRISQKVPQVTERLEVLSWPIDTEAFAPLFQRPPVRSTDELTLITVGRMDDPRKNIGALLGALPLVRASVGSVTLKIVGPGTEALMAAPPEGVLCLGRLSGADLVRELQNADLFVLPSLQEGLGLVVLEAMACGLPVVCTPSGGPDAHVRAGETGFLARDFSPASIAEAIIRSLSDTQRLRTMGDSARALVVAENGREAVAQRLRQTLGRVYETLIPNAGAS